MFIALSRLTLLGGSGSSGGSGTDPDFTTLSEGQMAQADAAGKLVYAHMTVDENNQKIVSDYTLEVPSGTLELADTIALSEATLNLLSHDHVNEQNAFGAKSVFDEFGTGQSFVTFAKSLVTVTQQSDDSTTITTNPLSIPTLASADVQTNIFRLKIASEMTNVRMSLIDTTTGIIQKYIPSKAAVVSGTGGMTWPAGDIEINLLSDEASTATTFNIGITPLQSIAGRLGSILIEADNMAMLGNGSDIPYVQNDLQFLLAKPIAFLSDTHKIENDYIHLNAGNTNTTAQPTGIATVYEATVTADTSTVGQFTAGDDGVSNPTVITDGSDTFAQNDLIQINGTILNNGLYEVEDHTGATLTVKGVGTSDTVEGFTKRDFETETHDATITKVNVSVIRCGTNGEWEEGRGSVTPIAFAELGEDSTIYSSNGTIEDPRTVTIATSQTLTFAPDDSNGILYDQEQTFASEQALVDKDYADNKSFLAQNVQQTGWRSGGDLSQASATTIDIAAGSGQRAKYNDPTNPETIAVSWDAINGYTPANILVDGTYIIAMADDGATVSEIAFAALDNQDFRDKILLGVIAIAGGSIIVVFNDPLNIGYSSPNSFREFQRSVIGPSNASGNVFSSDGLGGLGV